MIALHGADKCVEAGAAKHLGKFHNRKDPRNYRTAAGSTVVLPLVACLYQVGAQSGVRS